MTTLQNKECGKRPKRRFAPPTQKVHGLMPASPNSLKEDPLENTSPERENMPSLSKAKLEKNEKATTENGPVGGQNKKGKNLHKHSEKKAEKERTSLSNAEFEEIVQTVLRKSIEECLETSCAQRVGCIQTAKGPGIASITADNDNTDGDELTVPHTPASQQNEVVPKVNESKPDQLDPAFSEKKFKRLSLNKRKKGAQNEELEHEQEEQTKNIIPNCPQIKEPQKGESGGFGHCLVWVQCSSPNCEKWRQLRGNIDPSILPENWSCDQNTDVEYNRCDIPEETWIGPESDVAYASYIPGSIIWAKQYGYPWWPGMVESDPDLGEYFLFASHLDSLPSKYHITFFGDTVSRAWIPVNMLKNFQELSLELAGVKKFKNKDFSQKLKAALLMAQAAEQISIQERVNLFGFHSRYDGFDSTEEGKDLMLSEPDLEKEEMESEMEEGKKTDPTLPGPKPVKKRAKKPKPRGMWGDAGQVNGRTGTLQKKTKRSLGDEATAPPVLTTAEQEDQENSEPQQPALHNGGCPTMEKEEPGPQESPQGAERIPPEDEASSDVDLEMLLEDRPLPAPPLLRQRPQAFCSCSRRRHFPANVSWTLGGDEQPPQTSALRSAAVATPRLRLSKSVPTGASIPIREAELWMEAGRLPGFRPWGECSTGGELLVGVDHLQAAGQKDVVIMGMKLM
ncbi:PREDICTED: zinc finger CW-type PWWP domain protein 1 [Elephantulus edwardii]|uniref:zinc finger CW-type PWWP domain protein 1 n=1 Tax=Elephantulus edwardii TaxID=28737 RepID=UPI0003F0D131|nr:PREDICTED: zinc finger CW-type PWWP domain protein 1 [Elephantulus edwardii]